MLFRQILVADIFANLNDFHGLRLTVGRSRQQDEDEIFTIMGEVPNSPPISFDWVIGDPSGDPKISDVVAGSLSLRLTQRTEFSSYLSHGNDIDALINKLQNALEHPDLGDASADLDNR